MDKKPHAKRPRPKIPSDIRREVRQRCGFGCVVCGCPLYEYDHVVPYSETKQHIAEELTLLCDRHHKEKTNGLLSHEQVSAANSKPFNVQKGISSPYTLHFQGGELKTVIGGNCFTGTIQINNEFIQIPLSVDDNDLVWFAITREGNLLLNANIFDEYNIPVLRIQRNTLVYRTETWDIDFTGKTLTLREASRKILLELVFEPPSQITINRARLLCNGVEIQVRKSYIFVPCSGAIVSGCQFEDALGVHIGRNDRELPFSVNTPPAPRYSLSAEEIRKRERKAKDELGI